MEHMTIIPCHFEKRVEHPFTITLPSRYHRAHGGTVKPKLYWVNLQAVFDQMGEYREAAEGGPTELHKISPA